MTHNVSSPCPETLFRRLARSAAPTITMLMAVAVPGLAWAQTRVPPWQLGLCLSQPWQLGLSLALATLLAAALVAVLLAQRQAARHADQLAAVCGLVASLDRNARAAEAHGLEALGRAADRLEIVLGDTETTFRAGGAGETGHAATHHAVPDEPTLARLHALITAQAERDATTAGLLDSLRALAEQLPAQTEASAARLDAALADSVTERLGMFDTVGAAMARLVERADAAPGLARLETVASRLDGAAAAMAPLNDALLRLETTAGLPPLITRLIEQAQQAQSDLTDGIAEAPGLARLETVASRLDTAAAAMAPLYEALRRLEVTAGVPPLIVRLIEHAQHAQAELTASLSNAPGLARLDSVAARLDEAASAVAPLHDAVCRLESSAALPPLIVQLAEQARQAQADLTEGLANAPGLARLETLALRLDEAAAAMAPLNDALHRLETTADMPSLITSLIDQARQAQTDLTQGLANAPALARLETLTLRLDESAAAMAPLNHALHRLETTVEIPTRITDLIDQARQAQTDLTQGLANAPALARLETLTLRLDESAAAMAPLNHALHRLETTADMPALINSLIEQAKRAQTELTEGLANAPALARLETLTSRMDEAAAAMAPLNEAIHRLETTADMPALITDLIGQARRAQADLTEGLASAPALARLESLTLRMDEAAAAMAPLNEAIHRLETTADMPALITDLIGQARRAQADLTEGLASAPALARLESLTLRLDEAAAAMAPLNDALHRLESTSDMPALITDLIGQAKQAQADLTEGLASAPALARLESLTLRLDEAAAAMAPLNGALHRLEATSDMPALITDLIGQAKQAQADLTEGLASAPALARLEILTLRLAEAAADMAPLNDALQRLETAADMPTLITDLIGQARQAQADLTEGISRAPGLDRLEILASRLDEAAAGIAPIGEVLHRLETASELPALITGLIEQARQAQADLNDGIVNAPALAHLETIASQLNETAAAMAPLNDVLRRLEATAGLPPLITQLIEQARQAQADLTEGLAERQPAMHGAPHADTIARLEALSSLPSLMARLTEEAGQASSAFTETAAAAMAEITAAAAALAPLAETVAHLDALKTLPAHLNTLTSSAAAAQADFVYVAGAAAAKMAETASTLAPLAETATRLETLSTLPAELSCIAEAADAAKSILAAASEAAASVAGTAASFRSFTETASQLDSLKSLPAELHRLAQTAAIAQAGVANTADEAAARIAEASDSFANIAEVVQRLDTLSPLSEQLSALADNAAAAQAGLTDAASETASRIEAAASILEPLADILGRFEALAGVPEELARLAGSATAAQSALTNTAGAAADRIAEAVRELGGYADMGTKLGELASLAEKLSELANQATDTTASLAETSTYLGDGANATIAALVVQADTLGQAAYRLAEAEPALARLGNALAKLPDQLSLTLADRIQAQLSAHQDTGRHVLAELHDAFAAIPAQVTATLTSFSEADTERQHQLAAAWNRQHSETAAAIEGLAARADAAMSALPAEADMIVSMLDNASRAGNRLSDAINRLESIATTAAPAQALPDDMLSRLESALTRLEARASTETLEPVLADLRASVASLAQPPSPPDWLPRLAELDTALRETLAALRDRDEAAETMERAAAALNAAANETMGHGYAQVQRLDKLLARTAQPPAELAALPALVDDLHAALATQQNAAQEIQRAAADAAAAAARALAQGEAQQRSADRLLAAAETVRQAATPREGLAVIPGLVATCRALATDLGTLARGAPPPADLAARAPVLLAALQQGADDLRTAATSLALARDSIPDAA